MALCISVWLYQHGMYLLVIRQYLLLVIRQYLLVLQILVSLQKLLPVSSFAHVASECSEHISIRPHVLQTSRRVLWVLVHS